MRTCGLSAAAAVILAGLAVRSVAGPTPCTVTKLDNGVRVAAEQRPGTGLIAIDVWIAAGSGYETPGEAGVAHLLEHMLFRGSASLPSGGLDAAAENAGGLMNAGTMRHAAHLFTEVEPRGLVTVLAAVAGSVRSPSLSGDMAEKERAVILDELATAPQDPAERATDGVLAALWRGTGSAGPVAGTAAAIRDLPAAALKQFHQRLYRPERTVIAIVGDVPPEAALAAARRAFEDWRVEPATLPGAPPTAALSADGAVKGSACAVAVPVAAGMTTHAAVQVCGAWLAASAQRQVPPGTSITWRFVQAPGRGALVLTASGRRGSAAELRAWLAGFLATAAADPPDVVGLDGARRQARASRLAQEEVCAGRARVIGESLQSGDPPDIAAYDNSIGAVDREAIQRLLKAGVGGAAYSGAGDGE